MSDTRAFKPYPFEAKRYGARLPELHDGADRRRPVVIAGGGPVGLATALGLANHGVPSVVIEADETVCFGSRATCVSRRSLEIIQRLGALDSYLATGLGWTGGRSFHRDREVLHFLMPQDENQKLPPMVNMQQYYMEQFLLDAAERRPDLVDIRWQTRITRVQAGSDGVALQLSTPRGDYRMDCDWLVACDGGRSFVRESLGLKLEGTTYEGRYVIVDVALRSPRPTMRLAWFDPPSNPGSTILMHKQPDDVWRIDYQLRDDDDPETAVLPENVIPRVASHLAMIGESDDWAPIWIGMYRANAVSLRSYRHGRVLLAGDAAHLVPIFGVRGLNSGFEDADNVAWKLAFVVRGLAQASLLDSYSSERVHATRENLRYATKSTEFMAPPSAAFQLMRTAVLGLAPRHPWIRSLINPRQTQPIVYTDSPINACASRSSEFAQGPVPGEVLPECPLALIENGALRDGHLTDLVRPCFTVFFFGEDGTVPASLRAQVDALSQRAPMRLVTIARNAPAADVRNAAWDRTGRAFPMYGAVPGSLYLVRPDGYVMARWLAWNGRELEAALGAVVPP